MSILISNEFSLPYKNFDKSTNIGGFFIDGKICDDLIDYFNSNNDLQRQGKTLRGYEPSVKDSTDLGITPQMGETVPIVQTYLQELRKCVQNYSKIYTQLSGYGNFGITETFCIQKYKPSQGFKTWHFERSNILVANRCLVFMTYLNNVKDGGTEFYYQNLTTPAERGLTLIWPPDWTHTHRGQVSHTQEKYIITGWFSFV